MERYSVERYWVARARRLRLRVNAGWWLQYFLPAAVAIGVLGSIAILIARRNVWSLQPIAIAVTIAVTIAGVAALLLSRRRFFSLRDAFARLDLALHLFNRLTSAADGVGPWPERRSISDRIRWRAAVVLSPLAIAAAMIAGALLVPMQQVRAKAQVDQAEPIAWTEIEEIVDELAKEEAIDRESLEDWRERLEELRDQPDEQWFEHSSLEAGDHLREQLDSAMSKMEQDLLRAERMLEEMHASDPSASNSEALEQAWKQATKDLELGKLRLDPELAKELAKLDPSKARQLTPEEMAKLKQALENGVKKVKLAQGEKGDQEDGELLLIAAQGGSQPGQGEPTRGRADADLTLRPDPTDASTGESHNLASKDLTNARLGDVVGLSPKDHEIDPTKYEGPMVGGSAQRGSGGEATWKSSLPPAEQEFLERYFK